MGKQEEKLRLKKIKQLVKETPEQRKARVSSGLEPKHHVIPNKKKEAKKKETRNKKIDGDER
ncbi:MAG: hypothetical protein IKR04_05210 [Clostridia bacterium]|nr:hypothetical protein [Clostridia bacterium]